MSPAEFEACIEIHRKAIQQRGTSSNTLMAVYSAASAIILAVPPKSLQITDPDGGINPNDTFVHNFYLAYDRLQALSHDIEQVEAIREAARREFESRHPEAHLSAEVEYQEAPK